MFICICKYIYTHTYIYVYMLYMYMLYVHHLYVCTAAEEPSWAMRTQNIPIMYLCTCISIFSYACAYAHRH